MKLQRSSRSATKQVQFCQAGNTHQTMGSPVIQLDSRVVQTVILLSS